jgi:hypothetical protein
MSHPDLNRLRNQIRKVEAEKKKENETKKVEKVVWGILVFSLIILVSLFITTF